MPSEDQTRKMVIYLTRENAQFVDQERTRLKQQTGRWFTPGEIVQLLIEAHRAKWALLAEHDSGSVPWMYRALAKHDDD